MVALPISGDDSGKGLIESAYDPVCPWDWPVAAHGRTSRGEAAIFVSARPHFV